jgi:hypothetical protein
MRVNGNFPQNSMLAMAFNISSLKYLEHGDTAVREL